MHQNSTTTPQQTLFAFSSSLPLASKVPSASALQDISLNRISFRSRLPALALRASKLCAHIPGGTGLALACGSSPLHAVHHIPPWRGHGPRSKQSPRRLRCSPPRSGMRIFGTPCHTSNPTSERARPPLQAKPAPSASLASWRQWS